MSVLSDSFLRILLGGGPFRQQSKQLIPEVLVGKWGHSNRGSAYKSPEPLPDQLQKRFWNGKEKWVLVDVEESGGVCRAASPSRDFLGGSQDSAHVCALTAEMGHSTQ